ncbi:hypothetical protein SISNIDRAFT_548537 [Sistotremastrum niveocremeum HHB9708]|uniref:F-box domain-containing protein n=1 Tax=Sistotremastrum niveocremeum HHB9708 TaxID=1314777 RepID=A0A164WKV6_9AGAM|nr:hypothetical protein SISNIDRAFT_548537 [Sistotremastrum niveocremeum HHB9708]
MKNLLDLPVLIILPILELLDSDALYNCALVCKSLSKYANDQLWRNVPRLDTLLAVLSPLVIRKVKNQHNEVGQKVKVFAHPPTEADVKHFVPHANRVRRIAYMEEDVEAPVFTTRIARASFTRLQQLFPRPILPNLTHLAWMTSPGHNSQLLKFSKMFLHENMISLAIGPVLDGEVLEDILNLVPNLEGLILHSSIPVEEVEESLYTALEGLTRLEEIALPRFWYTEHVMATLSEKRYLREIHCSYDDHEGQMGSDPEEVASYELSFEQGAFPALRQLHVDLSLSNVLPALESARAPAKLEGLSVRTLDIESQESMATFFKIASTSFSLLTSLSLTVRDSLGLELDLAADDAADEATEATADLFRPALDLRHIKSFTLSYSRPLCVWNHDLEDIPDRWPDLEHFELNPRPKYLRAHSHLTLDAVRIFTRCKNIKFLGLHLDARVDVTGSSLFTQPKFESGLTELDLGCSTGGTVSQEVMFFSYILPAGCKIKWGVAPGDEEDDYSTAMDVLWNATDNTVSMWILNNMSWSMLVAGLRSTLDEMETKNNKLESENRKLRANQKKLKEQNQRLREIGPIALLD